MSGNLDDLEFGLHIDTVDAGEALRGVVGSLNDTKSLLAELTPAYSRLSEANLQLATISAMPVQQSEFLQISLGSILNTVNRLNQQTDSWSKSLESKVSSVADLSTHWNYVNTGVRTGTDNLRQFTEQARQAAAATQTIVVDTATQRITPPAKSTPFDLVKLAGATMAVRAVAGVSRALTVAKTTIADVGKTTTTTISSLDRFRIGMAAPKVDPSLNTLPGIIQNITGRIAGGVDTLRGMGDATVSGIPAILTAVAGGLGKVMGAGDSMQATVSKITSELELKRKALDRVARIYPTTGTAVDMLKKAMDFAVPAAERLANAVDSGNSRLREATIAARNLAYIATGTFAETGTSADLYARGAYHALLPTRMMAFEAKFAQGSLTLMRRGFLAVTSPVHSLAMAVQRSSGELRELRSTLPPLNTDLERTRKSLSDAFSRAPTDLQATARELRDGKIAVDQMNPSMLALHQTGQTLSKKLKVSFEDFMDSVGDGSLKVEDLNGAMKELSGGAQIGTRGLRVFAHATYFTSTAIRGVVTAAKPITWVGSQIWKLVRPAKEAKVGLDGVVTAGHKAGPVLRSVAMGANVASAALKKVATTGDRMTGGWISNLPGKARLATAAIGAMAIGVVMLSANFAVAQEKNEVVFGTMLKNAEQGKAVVASLQGSNAAGLFDNDELLNSGRLLFKAGISAGDVAGKTEQLATIASATSTELGDLARIYQQGANRGSFGQDKINQFAERGIDIYHALEATTGKSGAALADMISGGKIGITEMDAALAHLTEGNGIYAGSLDALKNTTGGMLSQIKNNFLMAIGGVGSVGNQALKPLLSGIVEISETFKTSFAAVTPVVVQVVQTIGALFTGVWSVLTAVFSGIFGAASSTFSGILAVTMEWVTNFRWFFENLLPVSQFVWINFALFAVTAFNDIAYWFTDKLPNYMGWFAENSGNLFTDFGNIVTTVFTNLGSNIRLAMTEIWDFISSGGTDSMELAFTPLLDGFQSSLTEMAAIPEREMTALEQSLTAQTEQLGTQLADSWDKMQSDAAVALTVEPPAVPEIDPNLKSSGGGMPGEDGDGKQGGRTSFVVDSLDRGSQAALNAIAAAQGGSKTPEKQLAEEKKHTALLTKLANRPQPAVAGGV